MDIIDAISHSLRQDLHSLKSTTLQKCEETWLVICFKVTSGILEEWKIYSQVFFYLIFREVSVVLG